MHSSCFACCTFLECLASVLTGDGALVQNSATLALCRRFRHRRRAIRISAGVAQVVRTVEDVIFDLLANLSSATMFAATLPVLSACLQCAGGRGDGEGHL